MGGTTVGAAALLSLCVALGQAAVPEPKGPRVARPLQDLAPLVESAIPAVVSVVTIQPEREPPFPGHRRPLPDDGEPHHGIGSGFFVRADGYVLTNAHVVEKATDVVVGFSENGNTREYKARIVGEDEATDLALLKVDDQRSFPTIPLGDSDALRIADWVVAIGNPFGLSHTVTVGVVSYKGRDDVTPVGREGFFDFIQTDASINPGSSGGPILNLRGEVVGIANAINATGQGIGFAIPINMAKVILPQLISTGQVRRSWLGVGVQDLSPEVASALGLPRTATGVVVSELLKGGPARQSGLQVGDVIRALDGHRVDRAQKFRWMVATAGVGKEVAMTVEREGKMREVRVQLAELPASDGQLPFISSLGVAVADVDIPTARATGLAIPFGARIRKVDQQGPGARAGLRPGDVVLKINEFRLSDGLSFSQSLGRIPPGQPLRLIIRRGARTLFLTLRRG